MPHKRTLIREAFRELIAGKLPAGINVSSARHRQIPNELLPLVNIKLGNEEAVIFNESPRMYKKTLEVTIETYAKAKDNIDVIAEDIMILVEAIIDNEDLFTLPDDVQEVIYKGSNVSPDGREAVQESFVAILRYEVIYFSDAGKVFENPAEFDEIYANFKDLASTEILDIHD